MKRKKSIDPVPAIITATVIATLAVVAAGASIAYAIHQRICRSKSLRPVFQSHGTGCVPVLPDDDELEF